MKFYESHYEEYLQSARNVQQPDIPKNQNIIVYGPPGVGKYTQALSIVRKYSPTNLKYEKKLTIQTDKMDYTYHISDIHYEIDMSLLGCSAKTVWRDIFSQITDIISVKTEKKGIIVCKNFHTIHSELLDSFYSYMQRHNSTIAIRYILITEHLCFLPNAILNSCYVVNVGRPSLEQYKALCGSNAGLLDTIDKADIINMKELKSFKYIKNGELPKDIFNHVCDNIIIAIRNHKQLSMSNFRELIYDVLTYNLDVVECVWHILYHLIHNEKLSNTDISEMLERCHLFLKQYNNNYRPIYHIESILFYFISKLYERAECASRVEHKRGRQNDK